MRVCIGYFVKIKVFEESSECRYLRIIKYYIFYIKLVTIKEEEYLLMRVRECGLVGVKWD